MKMIFKKIKNSSNIYHPESSLVLRSIKDKVVIGRFENKNIIPIDSKSLELCAKWQFK